MEKITLVFEGQPRGVGGFEVGEKMYQDQIKPILPEEPDAFQLNFPGHIEVLSSSFVQGLLDELIKTQGYKWVETQIIFDSPNEHLAKIIKDRIW